MRYLFQSNIRSGMGAVMQAATVQVYLAGSGTPANIYATPAGGAIPGSTVTSDSTGYFSFWVDSNDYPNTQLFKIVASLSGYQTQTYDYMAIFPMGFLPVSTRYNTSAWGSVQAGATWFEQDTGQFGGWTGSTVVFLG